MSKFLYFFLFGILIFSEKYSYCAPVLDYQPLDKNSFKFDLREFNELNTLNLKKKIRKRDTITNLEEEEKSKTENDFKSKRHFTFHEDLKKPHDSFSSANFQCPKNFENVRTDVNQLEFNKIDDSNKKIFPNTFAKWKKDVNLPSALWRRRRKIKKREEIKKRYQSPVKILDYSNSQMPFNEGRNHHKNDQNIRPVENEQTSRVEQKERFYNGMINPKKGGQLKQRCLRSQLENIVGDEIPIDGAYLEYSRVRRFLDHGRPKKRITSTTLEAKEAAMSTILDPNLNLDGILEPHVRKRRDNFISKRCLRLRTRLKNKSEVKED